MAPELSRRQCGLNTIGGKIPNTPTPTDATTFFPTRAAGPSDWVPDEAFLEQIGYFSQHSQSSCLYLSSSSEEEEDPKPKYMTITTPTCTQVAETELYGPRTVSKRRRAFILSDSDSEVTPISLLIVTPYLIHTK